MFWSGTRLEIMEELMASVSAEEAPSQAEFPTVRYVDEAFVPVKLVTVPVVPQNVGRVA